MSCRVGVFGSLYYCFTDTANTEIYTYLHTLSLHDALPIWFRSAAFRRARSRATSLGSKNRSASISTNRSSRCRCSPPRSEEHTSELQSLMRSAYAVFFLQKKIGNAKTLRQIFSGCL